MIMTIHPGFSQYCTPYYDLSWSILENNTQTWKLGQNKTKKPTVMIMGPFSVMLMHFLKGDPRRDICLSGSINWTNTLLGHFYSSTEVRG